MQLSGYCENKSLNFVIYYLDNFLVIGAPSSPECTADLTTQLRVFDLLGLLVAVEKLEGPCPCLSFLGFELDLEAVVIRLPLPKLAKLQHLLKSWEKQQLCTGKDLESWSESRLMPAKWCSPGRLSWEGCLSYSQAHSQLTITSASVRLFAWTCSGGQPFCRCGIG